MKKKAIGQIEFSPITMGCMAVADPGAWGAQDESETIRTMHKAFELGINCFDTAPGYGNGYSEELLGKAFEGSKSVIIATKISADSLRYDDCIKSCERSLKLLKRDYVDLLQVHWANPEVPFEETAQALIKLKEQGKIREYGVCNFGAEQTKEMLKLCNIKSNQLMYNLFFRGIEFELSDVLKENDLGLLTYSSLAQGLLTGKYNKLEEVPEALRRTRHYPCDMNPSSPHREAGCKAEVEKALSDLRAFASDKGASVSEIALAWLISKDLVTSVIAGARSVSQIERNAMAMQISLTQQEISELDGISESIKQKMGANLDPWRGVGGPVEPKIR